MTATVVPAMIDVDHHMRGVPLIEQPKERVDMTVIVQNGVSAETLASISMTDKLDSRLGTLEEPSAPDAHGANWFQAAPRQGLLRRPPPLQPALVVLGQDAAVIGDRTLTDDG